MFSAQTLRCPQVEAAGVTLALTVWKTKDLGQGLFLSRLVDNSDMALRENLRKLVREKTKKLLPYGRKGKLRILLLEGNDIAMLNHIVVAEALEANFKDDPPNGIDVIWYADAHGANPVFYNLTELIKRHF